MSGRGTGTEFMQTRKFQRELRGESSGYTSDPYAGVVVFDLKDNRTITFQGNTTLEGVIAPDLNMDMRMNYLSPELTQTDRTVMTAIGNYFAGGGLDQRLIHPYYESAPDNNVSRNLPFTTANSKYRYCLSGGVLVEHIRTANNRYVLRLSRPRPDEKFSDFNRCVGVEPAGYFEIDPVNGKTIGHEDDSPVGTYTESNADNKRIVTIDFKRYFNLSRADIPSVLSTGELLMEPEPEIAPYLFLSKTLYFNNPDMILSLERELFASDASYFDQAMPYEMALYHLMHVLRDAHNGGPGSEKGTRNGMLHLQLGQNWGIIPKNALPLSPMSGNRPVVGIRDFETAVATSKFSHRMSLARIDAHRVNEAMNVVFRPLKKVWHKEDPTEIDLETYKRSIFMAIFGYLGFTDPGSIAQGYRELESTFSEMFKLSKGDLIIAGGLVFAGALGNYYGGDTIHELSEFVKEDQIKHKKGGYAAAAGLDQDLLRSILPNISETWQGVSFPDKITPTTLQVPERPKTKRSRRR